MESCQPKWQQLQQACRHAHIEVIYTVMQSLTKDGRDRSLDYKISGKAIALPCPALTQWRRADLHAMQTLGYATENAQSGLSNTATRHGDCKVAVMVCRLSHSSQHF